MQIYGPFRVSTSQVSGTQSAHNVQSASVDRTADAGEASRTQSVQQTPVDQLDLSQAVSDASSVNPSGIAGQGIRFERVAELRRQIAAGNYDTPERMNAALDRMFDQLG